MSNRAGSSPGWKRTLTFLGLSGGILAAALITTVKAAAVYESPVASLVKLGFKFDGAQSCSASNCHGEKPAKGMDSYVKWSGKDKHSDAFNQLKGDKGKKIADGLKIADATASERCLSCHSMNVPKELQGVKFTLEEGNSCNTCHGPSEKWREAHSKEGWTETERKAAGSDAALMAKWGLYDTKSLSARAERCTSCHLAIEPDMIKAGHPTPAFELAYFSDPNVYEDRHWKDPDEKYYAAKEWVIGQAVCARDAMKQVAARASGGADADAVKDAVDQALGHYTNLKDATGDADVAKNLDAVKAAGADNAKLATAAQAAADAAQKQIEAVSKLSPDKAWTAKVVNAVAGESMSKDYGLHGVEQQAYAIYALYGSYQKAEGSADLNDAIAKLFDPLDKKTITDDYQKSLDAVKEKLPK
jgi:hypothetical protein